MLVSYINKLNQRIKQDKYFEELIKGASTAFILKILGIISGYAFTLLVTRTLGAEAWGIFTLSLVVLQVGSIFGKLGTDIAILRFTAEYVAKGDINALKNIYKKILILVIPTSLLVSIIIFFTSPILATKIFHKAYLTSYFKLIAFVIIFFVLFAIHIEAIRGLGKIKEYMILHQIMIYLFSIICYFAFLKIFNKYKFLPLISYSISVVSLAIFSIHLWFNFLKKIYKKEKLKTLSNPRIKNILIILFPIFSSNLLSLVMGWMDTIMLGIFKSSQEVGIYNVVFKLSLIISFPLVAINAIVAPKFAELFGNKNFKELKKVFEISRKIASIFSLPILIFFLIFSKFLLGYFGDEFIKGNTALVILIISQFMNVYVGSVGYMLQMTGAQHIFQNILLLSVVINFIIGYNIIPEFGINGAALSSAISTILWNILGYIYIKKKIFKEN